MSLKYFLLTRDLFSKINELPLWVFILTKMSFIRWGRLRLLDVWYLGSAKPYCLWLILSTKHHYTKYNCLHSASLLHSWYMRVYFFRCQKVFRFVLWQDVQSTARFLVLTTIWWAGQRCTPPWRLLRPSPCPTWALCSSQRLMRGASTESNRSPSTHTFVAFRLFLAWDALIGLY